MEQLFGKTVTEEQPLNYASEISLLLFTTVVVFVFTGLSYLLKTDFQKNLATNTDNQTAHKQLLKVKKINDLTPTPKDNLITTFQHESLCRNVPAPPIIQSALEQYKTSSIFQLPSEFRNGITSPNRLTPSKIIYQALTEEFKGDLLNWSANINHLTIDFKDAVFNVGGFEITQQYQFVLTKFCPRYISLLNRYANNIEAISIEGHSSSEWNSSNSIDDAYLNNMLLSQRRTNAVLAYCLRLPKMEPYKNWLRNTLIASGLSSSRLVMDNEVENAQHSRRVEFKIYVHSE
ncbi:OmpA family protein [Thiotrichales bacterium HSG1]|nr:OmpA family protein [Thiotrichales bacterium HSG1]